VEGLSAPDELAQQIYPQGARDERDGNIITFRMVDKPDPVATKEKGYAVLKQVPYITIRAPGAMDTFDGPVTPRHEKRYPHAWAAFKQSRTAPVSGLPLTDWPQMDRTLLEVYAFNGVKTVEALAAVTDGNVDKLPAGNSMRTKARAWIDMAAKGAPIARVEAENAELRKQLDMLQHAVSALQEQKVLASLPAEAVNPPALAKKRGRPAKVKEAANG
jgi:hypothetical protein